MSGWRRYWFAEGGRSSAAVVRIAIALAVLMSLHRLAQLPPLGAVPRAVYRPVGPWLLLGHTPPPAALVTALWAVAWVATAAMLVGLATRASTAASFASAVALAALSYAARPTWSHAYNVVFLAQLAFLGARGGDALSADALIRRVRGRSAPHLARGYQWSVRLVQLAVALMFASAVFAKLLHGHFTLRWALSDNLRHQLLVRYDLAGLPRPPLVDWLLASPWRYEPAALLSLIAQAMPLAACFLVRRPVLRALAGACFVIETCGIAAVVGLWNPQWLPLAVVFVDWDALTRRRAPAAPPGEATAPSRAARRFVAAFVGYAALTSFVPAVDQQLDTYPFTAYPMFSKIRARAPYDRHLPYAVTGDQFEIDADRPIDVTVQRWFDHASRGIEKLRDPQQLRARLALVLACARRRYPQLGIHRVRLYLTIFEAPAYPAPAHFVPHPIAIVGELSDDGTFRTLLGRLDGDRAEPHPRGLDARGLRLVYYRDLVPAALAIDPVHPALRGDPIQVVAILPDGTRWLVASRAAWHWN